VVEFARVAETFARRADGGWEYGSGYLITARLVLTAAHAVVTGPGPGADVIVRFLGDGRRLAGRVAWWRRDAATDVALVEVVDPAWQPPPVPPVRWGRLTGQRGGVPCEAVGFPDALRGPDDVRDSEHLSATVNPGTRAKAGRYDVLIPQGPTAQPRSSVWGGMSGAAVFSGELLIGVLVADPHGFSSRRLTALPAEVFAGDAAFAAHAGRRGLESVELAGLFETAQPGGDAPSPAFLLRPDAAVVPFHGRSVLLDELSAWSAQPDGFAARLVTGPGGQGKTRLAQELAGRLAAEGWVTGWLARPPAGARAEDVDLLVETTVPTLLIADYAETRTEQLGLIVERIATARRSGHRLRMLLLARSGGDWWRQLVGTSPGAERMLGTAAVVPLPALEESVDGRAAAFRAAARHFAAALPAVAGYGDIDWASLAAGPPAGLAQQRFGSVLALHMTALVGLLQASPAAVPAAAGDAVEEMLLRHEERYWARTAAARGLAFGHARTLPRAVAAATVRGAADEAEAQTVLGRLAGLRDQPEDRLLAVAEWLHDLYPAPDGAYWGQVQPDRLGEYLVGRVLADRPDLFDDLLAGTGFEQQHQSLMTLSRATVHYPQVSGILRRLVAARPDTLGPAAVVAATRIEHPGPLLDAVRPLAADLADRPDVLSKVTTFATAAPALFGGWLAEAQQVLVAAYRRMAADDPATYRLELAEALFQQSRIHFELRGYGPARAAAAETVEIRRQASDGEASVGLAAALDLLAVAHSSAGEPADALPAALESVATWERIVAGEASHPEGTGFVQALVNLSNILGALRRTSTSLDAAQRALRFYDQVSDPDPWLTVVATSARVNAANRKLELGDIAGGLADHREVVDCRRGLVEAYPNLFENDLASALHNLGKTLCQAGRPAEAMEPIEEAVGIYRRLVALLPSAYTAPLAQTLGVRAICLLARRSTAPAVIDTLVECARLGAEAGDRAVLVNTAEAVAYARRRYPALPPAAWHEVTSLLADQLGPPS